MHVEGTTYCDPGYSGAILSVEERTARLSERSLRRHTDNVMVVENIAPLYMALLSAYRHGIDANKEWLILIGADTVLDYDQMQLFLNRLKYYKKDAFCVSAYLQCKLRSVPRTGAYAYRRELLETMLDAAKSCTHEMRPQGAMHIQMRMKGYLHIKSKMVVGIHDYEQYYYDIYRTAHLLAKKWSSQYITNCITGWPANDQDYRAAMMGINGDGNTNGIPDIRHYDREAITELLKKAGIREKKKLPANIKAETVLSRCNFKKEYR